MCCLDVYDRQRNPFYEYYDEILDICREYDVTISLGDACRPGCLADASDVCQIEELVRLASLQKSMGKDVQVMVEGPGHMPMDQIEAKYEDSADNLLRCSVLCFRPVGDRYCPGL